MQDDDGRGQRVLLSSSSLSSSSSVSVPALPARGQRPAPPEQPRRRRRRRHRRPEGRGGIDDDDDDDDDDEAVHATVSLPPISVTSRHHHGGGTTAAAAAATTMATGRRPGLAVRTSRAGLPRAGRATSSDTPPVPPPRPESTISPWTRDIVRPAADPLRRGDRMEVASSSPAPMPAPPSPPSNISLTTPRPGADRSENVYVDAPLKRRHPPPREPLLSLSRARTRRTGSIQLPQSSSSSSKHPSQRSGVVSPDRKQQHQRFLSPSRLVGLSAESGLLHSLPSSVITSSSSSSAADGGTGGGGGDDGAALKKQQQQHHSDDFSKNNNLSDFPSLSSTATSADLDSGFDDPSDSILCRECGKCRCAACRSPRRLPSRWVCGDSCHLSAGSVVDALSCMWVVRAAMYHFGKDLEESNSSKDPFDFPCSCSADHACARWTCLAAASAVLPCLCCYLPMRCCVRGAEKVYQKMADSGCRCQERQQQQQQQQDQPQHLSSVSSSLSGSPSKGNVVMDEPTSISSSASSPATSVRKADTEKRLLG